MSSPHAPYRMEEESSSVGSPDLMNATANGNFDLTSYFLALANPDFSSSSSESQSQGSRGTTPSDWIGATGMPQPGIDPSWKWDADALTGSIDPNALILGREHYQMTQNYQPPVQDFHFEQPMPVRDMMTIPTQLPSQLQEQQSQLHFTMPEIIPPTPPTSGYQQQDYIPQTVNVPTPHFLSLPSAPPSAVPHGHNNDPDAIGRRARELVGVTYAITPAQHAEALRRQSMAALQQQSYPSDQPVYADASYPTPSQGSSPSPSRSSGSSPPMAPSTYTGLASAPKTKTSHTTIERRYRTNLNARIVALRHAVPALRILEKSKFPNEVVDERGLVDGVKAARKASKGNILGKAAEYIGYVYLALPKYLFVLLIFFLLGY